MRWTDGSQVHRSVHLACLADTVRHDWQLAAIDLDTELNRIELLTANLTCAGRSYWVETDARSVIISAYSSPTRLRNRPDTQRGPDFLHAERLAERMLEDNWTPPDPSSAAARRYMHLTPSQRPREPEPGRGPREFWDERFFRKPDENDQRKQRRLVKANAFIDDCDPVMLAPDWTWIVRGFADKNPVNRLHRAALELGVCSHFLQLWTTRVAHACQSQPSRRLGIKVVGRNAHGPKTVRATPHLKHLPGSEEYLHVDYDREDLEFHDNERRKDT
jgi:hypothetical protein